MQLSPPPENMHFRGKKKKMNNGYYHLKEQPTPPPKKTPTKQNKQANKNSIGWRAASYIYNGLKKIVI